MPISELNAEFNKSINPGELEGRGQFDFFNNDMEELGSKIEEEGTDADYNMILEILFQPQQSESLFVFGIHIFIFNNKSENAFSFLLNSHHDYFSYNSLFIENSNAENLEMLKLKCAKVAKDALKKQIEFAENDIAD